MTLYQSDLIQADISIPEIRIVKVHAVDVGQPSCTAFVTMCTIVNSAAACFPISSCTADVLSHNTFTP